MSKVQYSFFSEKSFKDTRDTDRNPFVYFKLYIGEQMKEIFNPIKWSRGQQECGLHKHNNTEIVSMIDFVNPRYK